jgi:hypothetical protein
MVLYPRRLSFSNFKQYYEKFGISALVEVEQGLPPTENNRTKDCSFV